MLDQWFAQIFFFPSMHLRKKSDENLLHLIVESARVHPPVPLSFAEILGTTHSVGSRHLI